MKFIPKIFLIVIILLPAALSAETFPEIDIDKLMIEKRSVVKETLQLTEKESAVFWPLYDEVEAFQVNYFKRYASLLKDYMRERKNLHDDKARAMIKVLVDLQTDELENKRKNIKIFSAKLSDKRVFQYLVLEERVYAGFFALIAEALPPIK